MKILQTILPRTKMEIARDALFLWLVLFFGYGWITSYVGGRFVCSIERTEGLRWIEPRHRALVRHSSFEIYGDEGAVHFAAADSQNDVNSLDEIKLAVSWKIAADLSKNQSYLVRFIGNRGRLSRGASMPGALGFRADVHKYTFTSTGDFYIKHGLDVYFAYAFIAVPFWAIFALILGVKAWELTRRRKRRLRERRGFEVVL